MPGHGRCSNIYRWSRKLAAVSFWKVKSGKISKLKTGCTACFLFKSPTVFVGHGNPGKKWNTRDVALWISIILKYYFWDFSILICLMFFSFIKLVTHSQSIVLPHIPMKYYQWIISQIKLPQGIKNIELIHCNTPASVLFYDEIQCSHGFIHLELFFNLFIK